MPDLSTIDSNQPADIEIVKLGAQRIRALADATKTSMNVEHALSGIHKFLVGPTSGRPSAGNLGRLFINLTRQNVELDDSSAWNQLHVHTPKFISGISSVTLSTSYSTVLSFQIDCSAGASLLLLGMMNIVTSSTSYAMLGRFAVAGLATGLEWQLAETANDSGNGVANILAMAWLHPVVTAGINLVEMRARSVSGTVVVNNRTLFALAL